MNVTAQEVLSDYITKLIGFLDNHRKNSNIPEPYQLAIIQFSDLGHQKYLALISINALDDASIDDEFVNFRFPSTFKFKVIQSRFDFDINQFRFEFELLNLPIYDDEITIKMQLFKLTLLNLHKLIEFSNPIGHYLLYTLISKKIEEESMRFIQNNHDRRLGLLIAFDFTQPNEQLNPLPSIILDALRTNDQRTIDYIHRNHNILATRGQILKEMLELIFNRRLTPSQENRYIQIFNSKKLPDNPTEDDKLILEYAKRYDRFRSIPPLYEELRPLDYVPSYEGLRPLAMPSLLFFHLVMKFPQIIFPEVDSYLKIKYFLETSFAAELPTDITRIELRKYLPTLQQLESWTKVADAFYEAMDWFRALNDVKIESKQYLLGDKNIIIDDYQEYMASHPIARLSLAMAYTWLYAIPTSIVNYLKILLRYNDLEAIKFIMDRLAKILEAYLSANEPELWHQLQL